MNELTEQQRKQVVQIANVNLLVGLVHSCIDQQTFIETSQMRNKMKHDYKLFVNAGERLIREWSKHEGMLEQAEQISDVMHNVLFDVRAKMVKEYTKYVLSEKD